jgi:hypothetical protein
MAMTRISLDELKAFERALQKAKDDLELSCNNMSTSIQYCNTYMKDPQSQVILQRGVDIIRKIRTNIEPIEQELIRVRSAIKHMESQQVM